MIVGKVEHSDMGSAVVEHTFAATAQPEAESLVIHEQVQLAPGKLAQLAPDKSVQLTGQRLIG